MKCLNFSAKFIFILAVLLVSFSACFADDTGFEFDDLMGNGFTLQWMAINKSGNTFGGKFTDPLKVSTDLIVDPYSESIVNILSGTPSSEYIPDRELHLLFLVLSQGYGEFYVDTQNENLSFDITTPDSDLSTIENEQNTVYVNTKEFVSTDLESNWSRYRYQIGRRDGSTENYNTVVQSINFSQYPDQRTSQMISRPLVISNVSATDAREEPLVVRMTLRDSTGNSGNIVAYDTTSWRVDDDKTTGGDQWVFVPIDERIINDKQIKYSLKTEIANHTSARYEAIPSDSYGTQKFPDYWKFDLPRYHWTTDIDREFYLSATSHIAPGLVSVFKRQYNVREENKRPLRIQGIDTAYVGLYNLYLDHDIVYGKALGDKQSVRSSQGNFNLFEVTAFQPNEFSMYFYDNVARATNSTEIYKEVLTPTTRMFGASALKQEEDMPGIGNLTQFFTVEQNIPGSLRSSSTEGLLPLHITINIPITLIKDKEWLNNLLDEWKNTGRIENTFAEKYELFLLTETNGELNPWNLTQELQRQGSYENQVKVFYDEDRGMTTVDNVRGLITISFIAMLMDGTRDGTRPQLSIVEDHVSGTDVDKEYIVIRDGIADNKWKMTFFVAEAGTSDNFTIDSNPYSYYSDYDYEDEEIIDESNKSSSCNASENLIFVLLPVILVFAFKVHERRF